MVSDRLAYRKNKLFRRVVSFALLISLMTSPGYAVRPRVHNPVAVQNELLASPRVAVKATIRYADASAHLHKKPVCARMYRPGFGQVIRLHASLAQTTFKSNPHFFSSYGPFVFLAMKLWHQYPDEDSSMIVRG